MKAYYLGYRDVQIDDYVDLLYNSNVIDNVANSRYKEAGPSRGSVSNQRPRTQLEANPANSIEEEQSPSNDEGFNSSAIPVINTDNLDGNLDDLRR